MAVGDIYEIVHTYKRSNRDYVNVWHFVSDSGFDDAETFPDHFVTTVIDNIKAYQTNAIIHTKVSCRNLFDVNDQSDLAINIVGEKVDAVESLPDFVAMGVDLVHDSAVTRTGQKRLGGFEEDHMGGFGLIESGFYNTIDTLLDAWATNGMSNGVDSVGRFFVVKLVKEIVAGVTKYRMPNSLAELVGGAVYEMVAKPLMTTQVSRKD